MGARVKAVGGAWLRCAVAGALLLSACTTYRQPAEIATSPEERIEQILAALDSLETGEEIVLVLEDGSSIRAQYEANNDSVIFLRPRWAGWGAFFANKKITEVPLAEIEYVSTPEVTTTGWALAGVGMVVFGAIVWSTFCCRDDDDAD